MSATTAVAAIIAAGGILAVVILLRSLHRTTQAKNCKTTP